ELAPARELPPQPLMIEAGEAEGVKLEADPGVSEPLLRQDTLEIIRGIGTVGVVPDPDVLDDRGPPRLLAVRHAREQRDRLLIRCQHRALKKNKAAGVEPGQVIVALLGEDQESGQVLLAQLDPRPLDACEVLGSLEVQRHREPAAALSAPPSLEALVSLLQQPARPLLYHLVAIV